MPSSPGYKRDYKREYAIESPKRKKQRAERNAARRKLLEEGIVHKHDGMDVDHKKPLSKGGGNSRKNLRARQANSNRSYDRTSSGAMKYRDQRRTKH
jgi:5-methylcytosine-specific restriction endonuclease McrA